PLQRRRSLSPHVGALEPRFRPAGAGLAETWPVPGDGSRKARRAACLRRRGYRGALLLSRYGRIAPILDPKRRDVEMARGRDARKPFRQDVAVGAEEQWQIR